MIKIRRPWWINDENLINGVFKNAYYLFCIDGIIYYEAIASVNTFPWENLIINIDYYKYPGMDKNDIPVLCNMVIGKEKIEKIFVSEIRSLKIKYVLNDKS